VDTAAGGDPLARKNVQSRPSQLNEIGKKVKITHVNPRSVRLRSNPGVTAGGAP